MVILTRASLMSLLVCLLALPVHPQSTVADGDSASFDFWIGEWDLQWSLGDTSVGQGRNSVTKILDGRVVQEQFEALSGSMAGFKGMSLSVFTQTVGRWNQTWVDNDGSYLDFVGGTMDDERYFERQFTDTVGESVYQRMVFYDITKDSFEWDWERSFDGGKTWELRWRIHYMRKKH